MAELEGKSWVNSRLVAHAPEKSVTAQCLDSKADLLAYAKVYAGNEGSKVCAIYDNFRASQTLSEPGLRVPRVLSYSEAHRALLLEAINGEPLSRLNQKHRTAGFYRFGSALASLHRVPPPNFVSRFKRLAPEGLEKAARLIARCRPDVAWRISDLAQRLRATYQQAEELPGLLHGDVHPKNGILANDTLVLIDLDQVGTGPAAADLGSLVGALHYEQCVGHLARQQRIELTESFLSGYGLERQLPTARSLRWHTAAALLEERALRAVTRVRTNGLQHMDLLLETASNILDETEN